MPGIEKLFIKRDKKSNVIEVVSHWRRDIDS